MTTLEKLLSEITAENPSDTIAQLRGICERIYKEEVTSFPHQNIIPKGPNIFLSLECPGRTKDEIAFLCLERELGDIFLFTLWTTFDETGKSKPKRIKTLSTLEVKSSTEVEPKKVVISYLKAYKYVKGE